MWDGDGATAPEKESAWEGRRAPWKEMSGEGPLAARRVRCPAGSATVCNQHEKVEGTEKMAVWREGELTRVAKEVAAAIDGDGEILGGEEEICKGLECSCSYIYALHIDIFEMHPSSTHCIWIFFLAMTNMVTSFVITYMGG
jgi:hypothetical protein